MRRDRMRQATIDAIGAWRAELLFATRQSSIKIRCDAPKAQSAENPEKTSGGLTRCGNG
jgi:hypothetical protein